MEDSVGCAVVTPGENKEIQLPIPFSIFNAEAEAINSAISITRNTIQPKRVILSDSPRWDEENLQPQGGENDELNLPREGAPERSNEEADQHAKVAMQRKTNKNYKTIAEDWKN
jgi:hypothetical protein